MTGEYTHAMLVLLLKTVTSLTEPMPDFDLMASIALTESGGDPLAHCHNHNGSVDRGLWQINSVHEKEFGELGDFRTACYIPARNAEMALAIWRRQGYGAWSSFNRLP